MKSALMKLLFIFSVLFFVVLSPVSGKTKKDKKVSEQTALKGSLNKVLLFPVSLKNNKTAHRGFRFPYAWGAGIEGFTFEQKYVANKLTLHNEIITAYSDSLTQDITGGGSQVVVRPEIWVLPYLNLYGLFGFAHGYLEPDITANGINLEIPYQDTVYTLFVDTTVVITKPTRYNGSVYGFGATAFYAYNGYFVEVDYNYSEVHPQGMDSKLVSHRFSPKIGKEFMVGKSNNMGAIWLGASWLEDSQTLTGVVNVREVAGDLANYIGEEAIYTAAINPEARWNVSIGGSYTINYHFNFAVEIGFLQRQKLAIGFMYRF